MAHSSSLFPLKLLVISLGVLLIGGTFFLAATLATRVGQLAPAHCRDATLDLKIAGKANISSITRQPEGLQITLATDNRAMVLTVDPCTGKVLHTLTILP